jgi:hypothetical protein
MTPSPNIICSPRNLSPFPCRLFPIFFDPSNAFFQFLPQGVQVHSTNRMKRRSYLPSMGTSERINLTKLAGWDDLHEFSKERRTRFSVHNQPDFPSSRLKWSTIF